ncbi:radical SAM domain-containing protein, partial [mine drainage metagenome]
WFGGEPLLATNVIYQVMDHAIASCNEFGVRLTSHITTNAYKLTRHVHQQLVSKGVNTYNISLDGDQSAHDLTRRRADGAGTFDQIWKNLCDMQGTSLEFKVLLRLHVTSTNGNSLEQLMQKIRGQFGGDKRYEVYLRGIANYRNDEQVIYPDQIKVRTAENAANQLLSKSERRQEADVDI